MNDLPTFGEFLAIAPIATLTVLLLSLGFYAGVKSQAAHLDSLKKWIDELNRK